MCRSPRRSSCSISRGSRPVARQLDLAARLAQLGRDPVQAERAVDLLLGAPGHDLAASPGVRLAREPVLVQRQALVVRHAAQLDVVLLAAGEVEQRRAERLRRHQPQVHLQAVGEPHRGLGVAARQHLGHPVVVGERRPSRARARRRRPAGRGRPRCRGAGGTSPPARRASTPGHGAQPVGQLVRHRPGAAPAAGGPRPARRSRASAAPSARASRRSPAGRAAAPPSPRPRAPRGRGCASASCSARTRLAPSPCSSVRRTSSSGYFSSSSS